MNLLDLSTYKTRKDLEQYATALFTQVAVLQSKLKDLEEKEKHARELLENTKSLELPETSLEEELLIREIKYIDQESRMGGLDLEKTKQLNLLIGCLVSIRKGEKVDTTKMSKAAKMDKSELLKLIKGK